MLYSEMKKDMSFQIPLGPELSSNKFNFNNCNYDRYSLEEVTTFSWRSEWFINSNKQIFNQ